jgi:hypothetical protein
MCVDFLKKIFFFFSWVWNFGLVWGFAGVFVGFGFGFRLLSKF